MCARRGPTCLMGFLVPVSLKIKTTAPRQTKTVTARRAAGVMKWRASQPARAPPAQSAGYCWLWRQRQPLAAIVTLVPCCPYPPPPQTAAIGRGAASARVGLCRRTHLPLSSPPHPPHPPSSPPCKRARTAARAQRHQPSPSHAPVPQPLPPPNTSPPLTAAAPRRPHKSLRGRGPWPWPPRTARWSPPPRAWARSPPRRARA